MIIYKFACSDLIRNIHEIIVEKQTVSVDRISFIKIKMFVG